MIKEKEILLVGTGEMGQEYAKILKSFKLKIIAVTRSVKSASKFKAASGIDAAARGLDQWLNKNQPPKKAIVTVTGDQLGLVAIQLIRAGCKSILLEKPGGIDAKEIQKIARLSKKLKSKVYIAYNRRFYSSVIKAKEIIKKEGLTSFNFDFTERSYLIKDAGLPSSIKKEWFLHNSTHIIDMAFFMGGWPKKINTYRKGGLSWHPSGSVYAGSGISDNGALFSYHANWASAGRWSVEIMTTKNKLIFRPLEKLQIQKYGETSVAYYPLEDELDINFKPGLFKQVEAFFKKPNKLVTIDEQVKHLSIYRKISGNNK